MSSVLSRLLSMKLFDGLTRGGKTPDPALISPYRGHLDYVERFGRELYATGWAWDSGRPSAPITVGIMSGDRCLATVLADKRRIDLVRKGKGNGLHAFKRVHIGSGLADTEVRNLRVHPLGERHSIPQGDCPLMEGEGSSYEGRIDTLEIFGPMARVMGWLWNLLQPTARVEARLLLKDQVFATVTADGNRSDLIEAGKGDGRHAFIAIIDRLIAPGDAGTLSLAVTDQNIRVTQTNPYEIRVYEEVHPSVPQILMTEANRFLERGEVEKAIPLLRKLLLLWPENHTAHARLLSLLGGSSNVVGKSGIIADHDRNNLDKSRYELKLFNSLLVELDQRLLGGGAR